MVSEQAVCFRSGCFARESIFCANRRICSPRSSLPPPVEVAKFWGVVWWLHVLGRADRALDRVQNCGLFICHERMEQEKKNGHTFVIGVPRFPLPFPEKVVFLGMSLWQKPPRQSEA